MTVESLSNGKIELIITESSTEIIINTTPPIISGGTADHSQLENLDFEHSGHTGFEPERTDNQNYVTDAQLIDIAKIPDKVDKVTGKGLSTNDYTYDDKNRLANTSGTNTGDQDLSGLAVDTEVFHKYIGDEIAQLDQKSEIVNDDTVLLEDSENEFIKVKTTLQKIREFFKTTYDTVYSKLSGGNTFSGVQSMLDGIKITKIYPNADGTTAIQFNKADGSTVVLIIDTTNGRLGVGKTPTQPLDVNGQGLFSGAIITSSGNGVQSNKLNTYSSNVDLLLTTATVGRIVYTDRVFKAAGYQSSDGSVGATGSFTSADGKTITVKNGLITSIV